VVCFLAQSDISPSRVGRSALGSFPIASAIRWAAVLSDGATVACLIRLAASLFKSNVWNVFSGAWMACLAKLLSMVSNVVRSGLSSFSWVSDSCSLYSR
jgi:hypothetical protein